MAVSISPRLVSLATLQDEDSVLHPEEVLGHLISDSRAKRALVRKLPAEARGPIIDLAIESQMALTHLATEFFNQGQIGSDFYGLVLTVAGESHKDLQALRGYGATDEPRPKAKSTWCLLTKWWKGSIILNLLCCILALLDLATNYTGHVWLARVLHLLGN